MTTIVVTRDAMYSDSALDTGLMTQARKIFRVRGHLIGVSGHSALCSEFLSAFQSTDTPVRESAKDNDDDFSALVLMKGGKIMHFDISFGWDEINADYMAIGSGASHAMTAMDMGATPEVAIEMVAKRDAQTRLPLQMELLKQPRKKKEGV